MRLSDLTPAARQLVESRSIARSVRLRPLLKLLAELQRWSVFNERRKDVMGRWQATGCSSLFWGPLAVWYFYDAQFWLYTAAVVAAAVALVTFAKKRWTAYQRFDVPNEVFHTVRPLLKKLRQDIDPASKLRFNVKLASAPAVAKKVSRKGFRSAKLSQVESCLLRIRIPLIDGAVAVLRIRSRLRCLEGWKQNNPGKMKKKRRWKRLCKVSVKFKTRRTGSFQSTNQRFQYRSDNNPPAGVPSASAVLEMLIRLAAKCRPR